MKAPFGVLARFVATDSLCPSPAALDVPQGLSFEEVDLPVALLDQQVELPQLSGGVVCPPAEVVDLNAGDIPELRAKLATVGVPPADQPLQIGQRALCLLDEFGGASVGSSPSWYRALSIARARSCS